MPPTDRSLPIAMIRARERLMAPIREMLAETGLTEQQWRVLRVLAEQGTQDASDLVHNTALLAPSLTRILKTLTEKGYITRVQDKMDGRRQLVHISDTGSQIIRDNSTQANQIVEAFKAHLGPEQYENLLDLLGALDDFMIASK